MELNDTKRTQMESMIKGVISGIDDQPDREGLIHTPRRVVKFYEEFLNTPTLNLTCFENEGMDEMIIQKDIPFFSLCEHHLLPFFGHGYIAYIPTKKIVGLSKLARVLDHFSKRLQNQERITTQIAKYLNEKLEPKGVAVALKARHLCMEMRGVQKHDTYTITSCVNGVFKDDLNCRSEFLNFINT